MTSLKLLVVGILFSLPLLAQQRIFTRAELELMSKNEVIDIVLSSQTQVSQEPTVWTTSAYSRQVGCYEGDFDLCYRTAVPSGEERVREKAKSHCFQQGLSDISERAISCVRKISAASSVWAYCHLRFTCR